MHLKLYTPRTKEVGVALKLPKTLLQQFETTLFRQTLHVLDERDGDLQLTGVHVLHDGDERVGADEAVVNVYDVTCGPLVLEHAVEVGRASGEHIAVRVHRLVVHHKRHVGMRAGCAETSKELAEWLAPLSGFRQHFVVSCEQRADLIVERSVDATLAVKGVRCAPSANRQ